METIHLRLFLMLCLGVHVSSEVLKRQKRNWIIDSFKIDEGYVGDFPYSLGTIEIEKTFPFFEILGQGVETEPEDVLRIDRETGEISIQRPVDYEEYQLLKLTFRALDRQSNAIDTQLGIEILILDANDNPPVFDHDRQVINIKEAISQGTDLATVRVTDNDRTKVFQLFDLRIVSVQPEPSDLEFTITPFIQTGTISFKGCLDYEKAEQYIIIVEAKGSGEGPHLSSSTTIIVNIEDGNNHLPLITGLTGPGTVKEEEENVHVNTLHVTDKDSKGTAAWRVKYEIHGDPNKNFRITTDPKTNVGLLFVEKHLDYEDGHTKNLNISVENEIPYYTCTVARRSTTDLWEVNTKTETRGKSTLPVTVIVVDVNEPPIFYPLKKQVTVFENSAAGKYLETFTARDNDAIGANKFVYKMGDDRADWVKVEPGTGKIFTKKIIDREATYVKNSVYTVTILAVDNGKPPLTGTGTLDILITDENDNAPSLAASHMDVCQSDGLSLANITGVDLDKEPYGGPFTFRLLEKNVGKWKLDRLQGYSVNLVKEPTVPSGQYDLLLEVLDLQGMRAEHNLSITVCKCKDPARPSCRVREASSSFGGGGVGILFFAMLLLPALLLLVLLFSCKRKNFAVTDGDTEQNLMKSNIENPGTDCKVFEPFEPLNQSIPTNGIKNGYGQMPATQQFVSNTKTERKITLATLQRNYSNQLTNNSTLDGNFRRSSSSRWSTGASSRMKKQHRNSFNGTWNGRSGYSAYQEYGVLNETMLPKVLNMMLSKLEGQGQELGDYPPHVYAEEGRTGTKFEPDTSSIVDDPFDPDMVLDLGANFNTLASICMPSGSAAHRTKHPPQ